MRERELNRRTLAMVTTVALGLATAGGVGAQGTTDNQPGDSASLSSGAPITAPSTADAGQMVNVVVEGAGEGARIELWGPVGESDKGGQVASVPLTGGVAALTAPDMSGSYELRYVSGSGKLLGRRAFDVAAVPVALTVTTPVGLGGILEVSWQGPAQAGDRFEVISASGAVVESIPVEGNSSGTNVSPVTAPQESGSYELRYVSGSGAVLRSVPFDVR
jgi:Ca-activated chloride channel homolog